MIQAANKQGRNEPCKCGSGKKFKKCCGAPVSKDLTLRDMMKCFYLLLEGARQGNLAIPKGPIPFSKESIAEVPDDIVEQIMIAEDAKFLVLTTKPRKEEKPKSVLILPDDTIVKARPGNLKLRP